MLEDDIGIDQIEHSMEIRQPIIGSNEFDIPDAFLSDVSRRFFQHGWRNVDANRTSCPPR
jgi:acid phosphatase class B